jgi:hypothetical protein
MTREPIDKARQRLRALESAHLADTQLHDGGDASERVLTRNQAQIAALRAAIRKAETELVGCPPQTKRISDD